MKTSVSLTYTSAPWTGDYKGLVYIIKGNYLSINSDFKATLNQISKA